MSTIASPRPSLTLSSRRTSTSTDTTTLSNPPLRPNQPTTTNPRRNRTALRDYYNLKTDLPTPEPTKTTTPQTAIEPESELDHSSFNPDTYITTLLSTHTLESVLQVEAKLISEIRTLDGEKKALVYDNYSKLIDATDTIRQMREKMDPVIPSTSSLGEDIGRVARTARELAEGMRGKGNGGEVRTVRWVVGAEGRLRGLIGEGRREDAEREWGEVEGLLDKWAGVEGVEEVRAACLRVMREEAPE